VNEDAYEALTDVTRAALAAADTERRETLLAEAVEIIEDAWNLRELDQLREALRRLANFEGITTPCDDPRCVECRSAAIARAALVVEGDTP
jgi:hypothetical protein